MNYSKPVILDGAAGTLLWEMAGAAGIPKDPTWKYNLEHPELVKKLARRYLDAGAEMIQTNTFAVNRLSVERVSGYSVKDVVTAGVKLAREEAAGTGAGVYLSSGPLPDFLEPFGRVTREECAGYYDEIVTAAAAAGVDAIMLETFMDVNMMRIAAESAIKTGLPVICSMTFEKKHRTLMGNTVSDIVAALEPLGISGIGMNCSYGPVEAMDIIREFRDCTSLPLYFKPNSGMGESYTAEQFAEEIAPALEFVTYAGSCCGSDESYTAAIKRRSGK